MCEQMFEVIIGGAQVLVKRLGSNDSFALELSDLEAPMDAAIVEWRMRQGLLWDGEPVFGLEPPHPDEDLELEDLEHGLINLIADDVMARLELSN